MSDTNTLPPIAAAPAGLSDATKASAAAQYKAAGYPDDAITAAGYTAAPAAPPVNSNVQVAQVPGSSVGVMTGNGITHEQAISAAKNLIAHGVDPAVVLKAAKAHGLTKADLAYEPPSADALAAAQRENEVAQGFDPPAKGESYHLQYDRNFAGASEPDALAALNKDFESAFAAAEVPASLAQPLLDAILKTGERYADESMTPAAAELMWREEQALFNKTSRDPAEDNRLAVKGFEALPKAMQEMLAETHSVHSAAARFQLAALGRALEYRASKKGK